MRLLGVIMTYNDDDCLHGAIESLLESNHSVWVFDHGSIDSTKKVVDKYPEVNYRYVDRNQIPNFNVPGQNNIHFVITSFIVSKIREFDWVTWIDSDETIDTMDGSKQTFYEMIEDAFEKGYQAIPGYLREYWLTEGDDLQIKDFRKRMIHYQDLGAGYCGGICRTWKIQDTPHMTEGTGRHTFFNSLRKYPDTHLLNHYPIRTVDQGYQKINVDRQTYAGAGDHYNSQGLVNTKKLARPKGWGKKR